MNNTFVRKLGKYKIKLLMLLPAVLYFLVFSYTPMAGMVIAFKNFDYVKGIFGSPWNGLGNFKFLFINGSIFGVIRNTVLYNAAFIIVNNFIEILTAIILMELAGKYIKKILQSVLFLPYFISWVVVGAFVYNLFNSEYGFINTALKALNIGTLSVYDNPIAWVFIIIVFCLWKSLGYGTVLYIAAIAGIDRTMYEAAEVDGANIFQRIRNITLPSLLPTIIILVLLSIGNIFRGDFSMFYQIVGDNSMVYGSTDVIDTFVIRSLMQLRDFGMSAAAAFIQSFLCFIIINVANYAVRRVDKDYALY